MTAGVTVRAEATGEVTEPGHDRAVRWMLFTLPIAFASIHLVRGAGFVLDDWFYLRNGALDGVASVVQAGGDRPVGRLIYTLFFGVIGPHPAPMLLIMAVLAGGAAVVFRRLLSRFIDPGVATVAAFAWVVVPSHLSLEVWPAVAQAGVAQLCGMLALDLAARPTGSRRRTVMVVALVVIALWSYESIAVVLLPGIVAVQWLGAQRLDRTLTISVAVGSALAGLWSFCHWNVAREAIGRVPNLSLVVPANFAWPFTTSPAGGDLISIVVLSGIVVVFGTAILRPETRSPSTSGLVGAGVFVLLAGTVPYVRYLYEPIGAGDRANYLSAFGASMVLAGLLAALWRVRRPLAVMPGVVLLVLAIDVRWYRTGLWSTAASDGDAVAHATLDLAQNGERVYVGPGLVLVDNITPFADSSTILGAVQFLDGSRYVSAVMVYDENEFFGYPEAQRIDQRHITELEEKER